jgi:hypothetical protein
MSPSPIPPLEDDDPSSPVSYFTLEARKQNRETLLGGEPLPAQPPTSPWGAGPGPGTEPPVDRRDDGGIFQREDFFEPTTEPTTEGDE